MGCGRRAGAAVARWLRRRPRKEAVWGARHKCGDVWRATTGMCRRARWKRSNESHEVGDLSVSGSGVKWVCLAKKRAKCAAAVNGEPR
ncbi:hypothetical protein U1Q18_003171 [Sarracenia purpurea var. burkii]